MSQEDFEFFEKLGFSKSEIEEKSSFFNKDKGLKNTEVFFYESKSCPESSFYFFSSIEFSQEDLQIIHSRVWNENKVKLYFTKTITEIKGYPAFTLPKDQKEIFKIHLTQKEKTLIESIQKSRIDSGYFWMEKFAALQKTKKHKTVNEELINALVRLKSELENKFKRFSLDKISKQETIQALIDRTLFIKFLEDRHIINSGFYFHYFQENSNYKSFLKLKRKDKLNRLFKIINQLFSNELFDKPNILKNYLSEDILECIYDMVCPTRLSSRLDISRVHYSLFSLCAVLIQKDFHHKSSFLCP